MNSRMLRILLSLAFLLAFSALLSQDARAADFTAQNASSSTINATSLNHTISITITNLDTSANITWVNITLYGFTFTGANSTNATNALFTNSSIVQLAWTNNTSLIANNTTNSFGFNVNVTSITGSYNITVNVTDTNGFSNITNITYSVVDNPVYQITFANLTAMQQYSSFVQNLSYSINITNTGSLQKTYNLTVVNCSNTSQPGAGILNPKVITLAAGASTAVELNVSNSTSDLYSSCIMAKHYNGSADTSNVTSAKDGVVLNSGFYPDINVTNMYWTSSGGDNPYPGGDITVLNVTLNNTGDFNLTANISVYLLWDGVVNSTVTAPNTSLWNGIPYNVSFSNITGITDGLHNLTVQADATGLVTESNETNNNKTVQVFVGYNVTSLTVTGSSGANAYSNSSVNVSVHVYYPNGTAVTGLTKYNFSAYDQQTGATFGSSDNAFNDSFTEGANGLYWFNITTPAIVNGTATLPGTHNLTVNASRNESGRTYTGGSSGLDYYYLLVPKLTVALSATSNSVTEGNSRAITISVTNTGTDHIYNVTLSPSLESDYLSGGSIGGCTPITPTIPNILAAQTGYITCSTSVTGQEVSDDTPTYYMVTATGNYNYSGTVITYYIADDISITVMNSGTSGDTGGGGTTTGKSCTSDSQCSDNEACGDNNKCATISCPNGEIIDHLCITLSYKINITSFEPAISAGSGGSNSTKVTVKNYGTDPFTAKLEVAINNVTATVSPASYSLGAGESYQFTVNFMVPETTTIGSFSGNLKAYVSESTSTYDSKGFTFTVLPKEETKISINASYYELCSLLSGAMANLSRMKASGRYNQTVLDTIDSILSAANATLLQVRNAIESDDYVSAQYLLSQVNASINNAENQIGSAPEVTAGFVFNPGEYGIWFWVAVVVIIIFVVGFFIYMFYPSSHVGYHPEKGYAHPTSREGIGAKIKKLFKRKKKGAPSASISSFSRNVPEQPKESESHYDTFKYSEGYKKESSYGYQYSKGGGGFFSRFRGNKEKKQQPPQMHLDQFSAAPAAEEKKE